MCNPATGMCETTDTVTCDGGGEEDPCDPCTISACNPATGMCESTSDPSCQLECGALASGDCVVKVDKPDKTFHNLQKAINAAKNGATIRIEGVCSGPVRITERANLTLEGVPPTPEGCPAGSRGPRNLTSAIVGPGNNELVKVLNSQDITIRFLNIVDGEGTGVEVKRSNGSEVHCNCIARNGEDGIELHGGKMVTVTQNISEKNAEDGIRLHNQSRMQIVGLNTSFLNGQDGIDLTDSDTEENIITGNCPINNSSDGIHVNDADLNQFTLNEVRNNLGDGIELLGTGPKGADKNVVDQNSIKNNGDGLTDLIQCTFGAGNTGSNVTPACQ
jgi:hypothetical protein